MFQIQPMVYEPNVNESEHFRNILVKVKSGQRNDRIKFNDLFRGQYAKYARKIKIRARIFAINSTHTHIQMVFFRAFEFILNTDISKFIWTENKDDLSVVQKNQKEKQKKYTQCEKN